MPRRRSLARRTPIVVYRIEPGDRRADFRAWIADEDGHLLKDKFLGTAFVDDYDGDLPRAQWLDSRDTDAIHELPEEMRDQLFEFDDAIRDALK